MEICRIGIFSRFLASVGQDLVDIFESIWIYVPVSELGNVDTIPHIQHLLTRQDWQETSAAPSYPGSEDHES